METLLREYLPHAPDHGLYVAPDIPDRKLRGALADYAADASPGEIVGLYDATRLGSAKDGAVFLRDRLVFQNNDLQSPRTVRYADVVGVKSKRKLLGGREVIVTVNRGRATIAETLDFSAQPGAAPFVERFLREAMLVAPDSPATAGTTDREAVEAALEGLVQSGALTAADRARMLDALGS